MKAASVIAPSRLLVVLSPGSRSTPLVLALAAKEELEVVDVIDERSAAFFALGHARASGRPAVVVATSGTAPAHWYPALIEASESGIPLLLLSADRPSELMHCGAPQTIDQLGLFGRHVRFFADLGDPTDSVAWLRHVERTVTVALDRATGPDPGPVHLDVRARKPLETSQPRDATDRMAERIASALVAFVRPERASLRIAQRTVEVAPHELDRVALRLARAERPLVLVGPLSPHERTDGIVRLAARLGAPIACEWGSQLRGRQDVLAMLDLLLEVGCPIDPDLLIQVGGTPTASVYERFVTRRDGAPLPRVMIGSRLADAQGTAEEVLLGAPHRVADALASRVPEREPSRWASSLKDLDRRALAAVTATTEGLTEGEVVRLAIASLPAGSALLLGNSLPIRLADRHARHAPGLTVVVQRGVNGIDGLIAGAVGTAHAQKTRTLAILGDVTALHDVGSLALVKKLGPRVQVLVLDNQGGRIFEQLPVGKREDLAAAMPHFVTEHGVDLAEVGRAFGLAAFRVHTRRELEDALSVEGPSVIVASVPPHGARADEQALRERVRSAISASEEDA